MGLFLSRATARLLICLGWEKPGFVRVFLCLSAVVRRALNW